MEIESPRTFLDPVHGSIQLEPYLVKIIDTPEFQRLRKIKQLGGACFVYPGATHTRFEHSIGVCHIAGHLIEALNADHHPQPPNDERYWETKGANQKHWISKEEEMCIKIAALCHDVGHGPYSHLYDFSVKTYFKRLTEEQKRDFIHNTDDPSNEDNLRNIKKLPPWASHEYRSALIVRVIMTKLKSEFDHPDYQDFTNNWDGCIKLIETMITFSKEYKKHEIDKHPENWNKITGGLQPKWQEKCKSYLLEIVANGFTGIDVDKMDYFARDSRSVGLPNSFDWRRFTQTARIMKTQDHSGEFYHICSRDKDATALYELFHTRNALHRIVYKHKTVAVIEHYMIKEALIEANLKIKGRPLLECWKNPESFIYLTDSIEDIILMGDNCKNGIIDVVDVEKSQDLFKRIKRRKLPTYVGRTTACKQACECKLTQHHRDQAKLSSGQAIVDGKLLSKSVEFDYGKDDENPMELHYFYSKRDKELPYKLQRKEVSTFLPTNFQETVVFWYYDSETTADQDIKSSLWRYLDSTRNDELSETEKKPMTDECNCPPPTT